MSLSLTSCEWDAIKINDATSMSNWNATKEKRKKISLYGRVRLKRLSISKGRIEGIHTTMANVHSRI
jgi:hypothetical protein